MSIVDVWMVPVQAGASTNPAMLGVLGAAERTAIGSLGFTADRDRAVTARAAARHVIGRRLGLAPEGVCLAGQGPPVVEGAAIHVSWSHSGSWVALAISDERPVGIDIEQIPDRTPTRALAGICGPIR